MWTEYDVSLNGLNKLCGSVPADPEIVKAWLEARKPRVRPPASRSIDETTEEVLAHLAVPEETPEGAILTFQRDGGACVMRAATIKAHLKDCARQLSRRIGRIEKEAAFSTRVINEVYPDEMVYWIPILRPDGARVSKHDDEMDRPVTTRFGTALKRFEWIEPWRLDFRLKVLSVGDKGLGIEDLEKLLMYGGVHGYAGERGNGEGKYHFTIQPTPKKGRKA